MFCLDVDLMDKYLEQFIGQANRRDSAVKTLRMWCERHL